MFLKMVGTIARLSLLFLPVVAITAVNCGDSGNGGTAGTTGTAGAVGSAGTTAAGGPRARPAVARAVADHVHACLAHRRRRHDHGLGERGGGRDDLELRRLDARDLRRRHVPVSGACLRPLRSLIHLCPNFDGKSWHITGTVHDYSGLGIYMNTNVNVWNVSMFTGLQFDISGTFTVHSRHRRRRSGGDAHVESPTRPTKWTAPTRRIPA